MGGVGLILPQNSASFGYKPQRVWVRISEETQGLRHLVRMLQGQCHWVEFQTAEVTSDLNTPESYCSVKRHFGKDSQETSGVGVIDQSG